MMNLISISLAVILIGSFLLAGRIIQFVEDRKSPYLTNYIQQVINNSRIPYSNPPSNPIEGTCWWNDSKTKMMVFRNGRWKEMLIQPLQPSENKDWIFIESQSLKFYYSNPLDPKLLKDFSKHNKI